ncbi:hypothetical protein PCH_Pc15g01270 [Penicillium rubens Wisconsin 54-1255]|uniref:Uncharacterized protein n=1 Tax=Penicillium rubens (strain ATCC 28089 / DSM 1075 / NRRL 1951 / Wisconsin 54-1255) TaxID=500485 RepID=B6H672_PENRW|nr:hypothetical protein PCH_Pc15g01270 [Penicillium rubens Wisconsin 54-1255]
MEYISGQAGPFKSSCLGKVVTNNQPSNEGSHSKHSQDEQVARVHTIEDALDGVRGNLSMLISAAEQINHTCAGVAEPFPFFGSQAGDESNFAPGLSANDCYDRKLIGGHSKANSPSSGTE